MKPEHQNSCVVLCVNQLLQYCIKMCFAMTGCWLFLIMDIRYSYV